MYLGLEPGATGWKVQMNPLSYVGNPNLFLFFVLKCCRNCLGNIFMQTCPFMWRGHDLRHL